MSTSTTFMKRSMTAGVASLIGLSTICSNKSYAQVINGGFETGTFPPFLTIGDATIQTSAFGSGPTEGNFQALITNGDGSQTGGDPSVPVNNLETFLGLAPGSINRDATQGSAIRQTFTANAGNVLSFDFNFLTNEATPSFDFNDFSFVTLNSSVPLLADTFSTFSRSPFGDPSLTVFSSETGFQPFSFTIPTTGAFTLGFGVADADPTGVETTIDSGLLVDNIRLQPSPQPQPSPEPQPIPEPSSILGLLTFAVFGAGAMMKRRRSRCQK